MRFVLLALVASSPLVSAQIQRFDGASAVPLACDATRIAIHDGARDAADLATALAGHDVDVARIEPWPIAGWWIVPTRASVRDEHAVRALTSAIARGGLVDFVSPVLLAEDGATLIPGRDVYVGLADPTAAIWIESLLARESDIQLGYGGFAGIVRARTDGRDGFGTLARANALALEPELAFVDLDFVYTGRFDHVPNDPNFPQCWGLSGPSTNPDYDLDATSAWDLTLGAASVKIAILDVGVQPNHPDLRVLPGADVTSEGPGSGAPVNSCDNHGTAVAGAAAAVADNALGACGVAPGCSIVPIRTLIAVPQCNYTWTTTTTWVVDALSQVQQLGCRVTNCSNGLQSQTVVSNAYAQLHASGVVHFASAGNSAATMLHYPARLDIVNGIGALAPNGQLASFSNTGTGLDFVAPGVGIWTTDRTGAQGAQLGDYAQFDGTSVASPYAAGVAALVLSRNPTLNAAQVDAILRQTAIDLGPAGYETSYGHGVVKARAALDAAGAPCVAPTSVCVTSPNTVGAGAVMTSTGTLSVLSNDLVLGVFGCPPMTSGRFVLGAPAAQAPFGNGFRCLGPTVYAFPNVLTTVFGDATQVVDWANLPGGAPAAPGQSWQFQFVYRNPQAGGARFNVSDGIDVALCP